MIQDEKEREKENSVSELKKTFHFSPPAPGQWKKMPAGKNTARGTTGSRSPILCEIDSLWTR